MTTINMPIDGNGKPFPIVPNVTARAVTSDDDISAATDITLDANTQLIEVNAIDTGVYLRYAATASSSDFDEYIQANTVRHYIIPPNVTVISVIQDGTGGKVRIVQK